MIPLPPTSTLFPYTTLFRSREAREEPLWCERDVTSPRRGLRRRREEGAYRCQGGEQVGDPGQDRKSTRLNSSHVAISYAVFCLKKKQNIIRISLQLTLYIIY